MTTAREMFASDRASHAAGIELQEADDGHAVATMTVTADMINGYDIAHGGFVFLLADTTFALACNTRGCVTVAAGADVTFIRPARLGDHLRATATEQVRHGRSGIYDVTVTDADSNEVVAVFRGRSRALGARS